MIKKIFSKKAVIIIEYAALIMFLLAAFWTFRSYIVRGFYGRWQAAGDAFGHGRQYDPRPFGLGGDGGGTADCMWVEYCPSASWIAATQTCSAALNTEWIDKRYYDDHCDCLLPGDHSQYPNDCLQCMADASTTIDAFFCQDT